MARIERKTFDLDGAWLKAEAHSAVIGYLKCLALAALLLLVALALTGCQTTKYLTRSCLTPEQYQQLKSAEPPRVHDKLTGKADEDLRTVAGSNIRLRSYATDLLGVLEVCAR